MVSFANKVSRLEITASSVCASIKIRSYTAVLPAPAAPALP